MYLIRYLYNCSHTKEANSLLTSTIYSSIDPEVSINIAILWWTKVPNKRLLPLNNHCRRLTYRLSTFSHCSWYSLNSPGFSCKCRTVPLTLMLGKVEQYLAETSFLSVPIVIVSCLHSGPETSLCRSNFSLAKLYRFNHLKTKYNYK